MYGCLGTFQQQFYCSGNITLSVMATRCKRHGTFIRHTFLLDSQVALLCYIRNMLGLCQSKGIGDDWMFHVMYIYIYIYVDQILYIHLDILPHTKYGRLWKYFPSGIFRFTEESAAHPRLQEQPFQLVGECPAGCNRLRQALHSRQLETYRHRQSFSAIKALYGPYTHTSVSRCSGFFLVDGPTLCYIRLKSSIWVFPKIGMVYKGKAYQN